MTNIFTGTGSALLTPFNADESIDFASLKKLIDHVSVEGGPEFLTVLGTTGEVATLTSEEKTEVLAFVKANNSKKLPIMYGIGGNNTREILANIEKTDFNGVQAILSVCPYYNKPSQDGIYKHFIAIADKSPVPVMLYNIPGRTGVNMTAETTIKLSQHKNIFGIKEASGDLMQCIEIVKGTSDDFILTAGDDLLSVPMASIGGKGSISVLSNIFPKEFASMVRSAVNGDFAKANQILHTFLEINPLLYLEGNPVGAKYVLSELNVLGADVRLPLSAASENLRAKLSLALKKYQSSK